MSSRSKAKDPNIDRFLDRVIEWAQSARGVCGLALVGSYARGASRPDSDIDLVVVTLCPADYIRATDWAGRFGTVSQVAIEPYGEVTSVRVHYADGPEVEFGFTGPQWAALPLDPGTREVLLGGVRVLWEREPLLTGAQAALEPA